MDRRGEKDETVGTTPISEEGEFVTVPRRELGRILQESQQLRDAVKLALTELNFGNYEETRLILRTAGKV